MPFNTPLTGLAPLLTTLGPGSTVGNRGVRLGQDRYGRPELIDPAGMHHNGVTLASLYLVIAGFGHGKTALLKALAARLAVLTATNGRRMRISVDDSKRNHGQNEWYGVVQAFGATEVSLRRQPVNLLDPAMEMEIGEQLAMLLDFLEHLSPGCSKQTELQTALGAALSQLHTHPNAYQRVDTLINLLGYPEQLPLIIPGTNAIQRVDQANFELACTQLTQLLANLIKPDGLGRMFGGQQSIAELMSQPLVAYDFSDLDSDELGLVQAMFWRWRAAALRRQDPKLMVDLTIGDENYLLWQVEAYAQAMFNYIKTVRGSGGTVVLSTQAFADYAATGSKLAETIVSQIPNVFIGRLSPKDAAEAVDFLRLDKQWTAVLKNLRRGQFLYCISGRPPRVITVQLTPWERQLAESDQATKALFT